MTTPKNNAEAQFRDAYREALALQNAGQTCKHCGSPSGHYGTCELLNKEQAETLSAEGKSIDDFFLRSLRIQPL
jgi:hypothetical protein